MRRGLRILGCVGALAASAAAQAPAPRPPAPPTRSAGLQTPLPATEVRGRVTIAVQPRLLVGDRVYYYPQVRLLNEADDPVATLELAPQAGRPPRWAGACDVSGIPDGRYLLEVRVPYVTDGRAPAEIVEEIVVGVRNAPRRIAAIRLVRDGGEARAGQSELLLVATALDARGQPVPGARLEWRTSLGELDEAATITDDEGSAQNSLASDVPGMARITVAAPGAATVTGQATIAP